MKIKKALTLYNTEKGVANIDYKAIIKGYELAGFTIESYHIDEVYNKLSEIDLSSYDVILFAPMSNALWNSGKHRAYTFEKIAKEAKPGALSMYVSDITFPVNPFMWDKNEEPSVSKRNVLNLVPIKVIASFDDNILSDSSAIERIKKIWMSKLHPESTIHFIEWLSFLFFNYKKPIKNILPPQGHFVNMYYGLEKRKLKSSLLELGMTNKDSLAYGNCSKMLPDCTPQKAKDFDWVNYLDISDNILVPYEPIKCDYQITLRHLEALKLYKDKVKIDPRVSEHIQKCIMTEEEWISTSQKAKNKIIELYKEG